MVKKGKKATKMKKRSNKPIEKQPPVKRKAAKRPRHRTLSVPPPSWNSIRQDLDDAMRRLGQAQSDLDSSSRKFDSFRQASTESLHLDLARSLLKGPDGGALQGLLLLNSQPTNDPEVVKDLTGALLQSLKEVADIERVHSAGETLELQFQDLQNYEIEQTLTDPFSGKRPFSVLRPGWKCHGLLVVRPLIIPILDDEGSP